MQFSGVYIDWSDDGLSIHPWLYIYRLQRLPSDPNLYHYVNTLLNFFLFHNRSDVCVFDSELV